MLALQTMQTSKPIPSTLSTLPNKHLDYEINCEQLNTRSTQLYRVYKIQDLNPHLSLRLLGEIFTVTRTLRRRECTIIKRISCYDRDNDTIFLQLRLYDES